MSYRSAGEAIVLCGVVASVMCLQAGCAPMQMRNAGGNGVSVHIVTLRRVAGGDGSGSVVVGYEVRNDSGLPIMLFESEAKEGLLPPFADVTPGGMLLLSHGPMPIQEGWLDGEYHVRPVVLQAGGRWSHEVDVNDEQIAESVVPDYQVGICAAHYAPRAIELTAVRVAFLPLGLSPVQTGNGGKRDGFELEYEHDSRCWLYVKGKWAGDYRDDAGNSRANAPDVAWGSTEGRQAVLTLFDGLLWAQSDCQRLHISIERKEIDPKKAIWWIDPWRKREQVK